jgi:large subunit ribosomal protein L15
MITLNNLLKTVGKKTKRIGRGEGSGVGKNCGKGHKGQTKHGGKRPLYFTGNNGDSGMSVLGRTPKRKGFKQQEDKSSKTINTGMILKAFKDGESVSLESLKKTGLIDSFTKFVKVIASSKETKLDKIKIDENDNLRLSKGVKDLL